MKYQVGTVVYVRLNKNSSYAALGTIMQCCEDGFYKVQTKNGDIFLAEEDDIMSEPLEDTKESASYVVLSNRDDNTIIYNNSNVSIIDNTENFVVTILETTLDALPNAKCDTGICSLCEYFDVGLYCSDTHNFKWKYEDKARELLKRLKSNNT